MSSKAHKMMLYLKSVTPAVVGTWNISLVLKTKTLLVMNVIKVFPHFLSVLRFMLGVFCLCNIILHSPICP